MSVGGRGRLSLWRERGSPLDHLSRPTASVHPEGSFPVNFSVLATLRAQPANQSVLLSIYDERGARQLGLVLGPALGLLGGTFGPFPQQANLADGR